MSSLLPVKKKSSLLPTAAVLAGVIPILLPVAHMFIFTILWGKEKVPVNKNDCHCSCWDTIYKGVYENGQDVGYKHVYFNCNTNTLKMWTSTVFFIVVLYESFKYFFLLLLQRKVRWTMAILFLGSLHTHYYAWWVHWGYWNEDLYHLWNHQVFFTLTEGVSYVLVLLSMNCEIRIPPKRLVTVITIALFHIYAGGMDQFIRNVLYGEGDLNKILRDVMFMGCDVIYAAISLYELRKYAVEQELTLLQFLRHRSNIILSGWLCFAMILFVIIYPAD